MTLDAFGQRTRIPFPWAVTTVAVVTIGVFAAMWLNGQPPWVVALATLGAALFTVAALTTSGPIFETRVFRVGVHFLLGTLILLVAGVMTALGAAEGALAASLVNIVVLVSLSGVGVALVFAGFFQLVEAPRWLRVVTTFGLAVTVISGGLVVLLLGGIVFRVLLEGIDVGLAQDFRDDLIPFLALFVSFVVFPALVFLQDLRGLRALESSGTRVGELEEL